MRSSTSSRAFIAAFAASAFLWTLVLGASPQLHERIHPDANRADHSCAVTFVASGAYNHSPPTSVVAVPVPAFEFCRLPALNSVWVQPLFLGAHIFAHAPPAFA